MKLSIKDLQEKAEKKEDVLYINQFELGRRRRKTYTLHPAVV